MIPERPQFGQKFDVLVQQISISAHGRLLVFAIVLEESDRIGWIAFSTNVGKTVDLAFKKSNQSACSVIAFAREE